MRFAFMITTVEVTTASVCKIKNKERRHFIMLQLIFGLLAVRPQRQGGTAVHPGYPQLIIKTGRGQFRAVHALCAMYKYLKSLFIITIAMYK